MTDRTLVCDACVRCLERYPFLDPRHPASRMVVCPTCGNKRCPKAEWHEYECSGSNEVGQVGRLAGERTRTMTARDFHAERAAHIDTERQLRDALARGRADVARLEAGNRVMREEFDRMCEALQKHVGGEGLGGEWYPDLVAGVVEERDRLRSELCAARQDLDVAESRKSDAFRRLRDERDEARAERDEARAAITRMSNALGAMVPARPR
jgi:hypothetical protein